MLIFYIGNARARTRTYTRMRAHSHIHTHARTTRTCTRGKGLCMCPGKAAEWYGKPQAPHRLVIIRVSCMVQSGEGPVCVSSALS